MLLIINIFDFPVAWQLFFQDPATVIMEHIIDLHHDIMFFLILIIFFVLYMLIQIIVHFSQNYTIYKFNDSNLQYKKYKEYKRLPFLTHNTLIEIIWILIPTIILILIAIPSFSLIYEMDESNTPELTLKIIAHQWYWTYEYGDFFKYARRIGHLSHYMHDSYMVKEEDLLVGDLRLLTVDFTAVLPTDSPLRLLISSADVIHSWTIPSLGVKMDAVPGRLNQVFLTVNRHSIFYGQCSELCGINHSFMPICVETVDLQRYFFSWIYIILACI
jgi:cytochrome c oxidase subunit 2